MRIVGSHTDPHGKKKKVKPLSRRWTKKLDDFCRDQVKINAGFRCERCGEAGEQIGGSRTLHWAHIAGRGKKATRWGFSFNGGYFWNAVALCGGDHLWLDNAENRLETIEWLESKFGRMTMVRLTEESRKTDSWGKQRYEDKWHELESLSPGVDLTHSVRMQ